MTLNELKQAILEAVREYEASNEEKLYEIQLLKEHYRVGHYNYTTTDVMVKAGMPADKGSIGMLWTRSA